jgi:hypothetical protein
MLNEPSIKEQIDATAGMIDIGSTQLSNSSIDPKQGSIRYLSFDRYEVGFVEDEDQRVIGICSIKVVRDFYDIDQMERGKFYWSPEDYDSPD